MRKKINWLNHSLEFFVVLIGILIAFQLNKCSDNLTKRKLIASHLSYITAECEDNEKKLTAGIEQIGNQISFCDSLLTEMSASKDLSTIRNYAMRLLNLQNVDLSTNAYEVLTQSGDIRFLNDYEQKRKIITLYDSFKNVEKVNVSNSNLYDNHYYPYLKSNFDMVNWTQPKINSADEEAQYYSNEFTNTVSTYRYLLLASKRIYEKEKSLIGDYLGN